MAKTNKQNPLKYFNDQADARSKKVVEGNKKLLKAQVGTAFQSYLKNVPGAAAGDTLGKNDPRDQIFDTYGGNSQKNALAAAFQKTYGNVSGKSWAGDASMNEKDFRIPQNKKTVSDYTKSVKAGTNKSYGDYNELEYRKKGGAVKTKKKK